MNAITSHYPGSFEEAFSVQHLAGKPIRKTRAFEMKWWNYKSYFQIYILMAALSDEIKFLSEKLFN